MKKIFTVSVVSLLGLAFLFTAGCKKTTSDPAEAIVGHMKAVFKLMKDNKDDCEKMQKEVISYTESNKEAIQATVKRLNEMEKKLSEAEKKKYKEKVKKMSEDMMKESLAVMMEVAQKCPSQMPKVNKAIDFMKGTK